MKTTKKAVKAVSNKAVKNVVVKDVTAPVVNALTVDQLKQTIINANAAYIARNATPKLNKFGMQNDLRLALDLVNELTPAQLKAIADLEITEHLLAGLSNVSNVKASPRTLQAALFVITGSGKFLKSSAKTFILQYCAIVSDNAKTRDALAFCATGKGNEHTSSEVNNSANARKLFTALTPTKSPSEKTQYSCGFSKNGIGEILNVCKKDGRVSMPKSINSDSKFTMMLNTLVAKLTDNQIALIAAQSAERNS